MEKGKNYLSSLDVPLVTPLVHVLLAKIAEQCKKVLRGIMPDREKG